MKKMLTLVLPLGLLVLGACNRDETKVRTDDGNFTLKAPPNTTISRGSDGKEIEVAIKRDGFEGPVDLQFEGLPDNVKIVGDKKIEKGSNKAALTVKADAKAPKVDDQVIDVKGSGGGTSGTVTFKLTVKD